MPRRRKTLSGDPALPARAPVGVPYGEGERALESQRRTPLPNNAQAPAPTAPGGGGGAPSPDMALQAAMGMASPDEGGVTLSTPSQRPNEPLIKGMDGDPSRPTIHTNPAYYELKALAKAFPYPDLLRLLSRVETEM